MNDDQNQSSDQARDKYFGEISIIREAGGDDFSNDSNYKQEVKTIKRTRKQKIQRLDAAKLANNSFIARIT